MRPVVAVALSFLLATPVLAVAPGSAPAEGPVGAANVQLRVRPEQPNAQLIRLNALRALNEFPPRAANAAPPTPAANVAADTTPAAAPTLTADTIATANKPDGFTYAIVRDAIVDELGETMLYVKANKDAKTTTAVPVPKDRALLARCVAGNLEDLVHGAIVTAKYDPRGVVRPEIVIQSTPTVEVLDDVKVVDRAGSKLFVLMADKTTRAFAIEGGADAWASVVQNGKPEDLVAGAVVKIEYDPSGREGIKITLKSPPVAAPVADKGCGCSVYGGGRTIPLASLGFAAIAVALVLRRRSRAD